MSRDWRAYLDDMIEHRGYAAEFTSTVSYDQFRASKEKFLAVTRALEIAGEAAKHVPTDVRLRNPHIDWRSIAGFRDVLSHGYFNLKDEIVWDAARNKAPAMREALLRLLSEVEQEEGG